MRIRDGVMALTAAGMLAACGGGGGGGGYQGCVPQCSARNCGSDACGGTCGTCGQGFTCNGAGSCTQGCSPSCNGKSCGSDGCGGSCGSCGKGFTCGGAGGCEVSGSSLWVLTITSGKIAEKGPDGASWDYPGGLPDPFICLTINGLRRCTSTVNDTLAPVWDESFPAATALALQAGVIVEMWDEDLSADDPMCGKGTVAVEPENLKAGTWGAVCTYAAFSATLQPK
ncbi:MAG: hypothetical protein EXR72_08015 [Myxococcales bacterium]|nr:hypothetical protein [Myxococcales bacterium]